LSEEIVREGVHIINSVERDVTNRGVHLSMTTEEKLKRYLEIKGITNDRYLTIGKALCNLQEIDFGIGESDHSTPTEMVEEIELNL
jgi:hypothetical protein